MTALKENTLAPKGVWFWVMGMTDGKCRVRADDGKPDRIMKKDEYLQFKRENTELPSNDYQDLFPPIQAQGAKKVGGGSGISEDIINAAFEFMKQKVSTLEEKARSVGKEVTEMRFTLHFLMSGPKPDFIEFDDEFENIEQAKARSESICQSGIWYTDPKRKVLTYYPPGQIITVDLIPLD